MMWDKITAVLICAVWVVIIIGILIYQNMDKHRFRARLNWKALRETCDRWAVLVCAEAELSPETAALAEIMNKQKETYFTAKKPELKIAEINRLAGLAARLPDTPDGKADGPFAERLALEAVLAEESGRYNENVRKFNQLLELPVIGNIGRILRFRQMDRLVIPGECPEILP
jgi:hypothetical protein